MIMKTIYTLVLFLCFSFVVISQSIPTDSLKSFYYNNVQQNEPVNVFYDNFNNKFVIENSTLQNQIFTFSIYNITGTCIKEIQCETNNFRNLEIPIQLYSGMYIVNISNKTVKYTKKFIIK